MNKESTDCRSRKLAGMKAIMKHPKPTRAAGGENRMVSLSLPPYGAAEVQDLQPLCPAAAQPYDLKCYFCEQL